MPIVQVNMGHVQQWDTHSANFKSLKDRLLPPTDRGVSAMLDDLKGRGLLDETLVVMTGEFGRTPRIGSSTGNANTPDDRDHWAAVFSAVFAGAGVEGGRRRRLRTVSAPTRQARRTLPATSPRPSTGRSASIPLRNYRTASAAPSGSATASRSPPYTTHEWSSKREPAFLRNDDRF